MSAQLDSIKIEQLSILLAAVKLGSFAAVAQERNISASSISRTIQGLEEHLGFQLFERSTRHLQLTEAGTIYCESIKPGLDSLCQAQVKALDSQNIVQGTLRMTLPPGFAEQKILPVLKKFRKLHPQLNLEILIDNEVSDLVCDRIDIAVRVGDQVQTGLVVIPLSTVTMKLVATPEFLTECPIETLEDLEKVPTIHFLNHYVWNFTSYENEQDSHDIEMPRTILTSNVNTAREMCLQGFGVSLLPDWLIGKALHSEKVIELFGDYRVALDRNTYRINLLYPNTSYLPMKTRVFANFLEKELSAVEFK